MGKLSMIPFSVCSICSGYLYIILGGCGVFVRHAIKSNSGWWLWCGDGGIAEEGRREEVVEVVGGDIGCIFLSKVGVIDDGMVSTCTDELEMVIGRAEWRKLV